LTTNSFCRERKRAKKREGKVKKICGFNEFVSLGEFKLFGKFTINNKKIP